MPDRVHDVTRAVPLAAVPAHNVHEGGVQHAASLGIKGEEDRGGLEAGGNQCLVCEQKNLSSYLLSGVSSPRRSLPGGLFLNLDSEVNHKYINGRSAQSMDILCYVEVHG